MKKLVLKNEYHAVEKDTIHNEDHLFDDDRNMVGNNEDEIRDGIGDGRRKRGFSQLSISPGTQSPPRKVVNNFKPFPDHSIPSSSRPKPTLPPQLVDHFDSDALPLLSPTLLQFEERKQGSASAADDVLPPCVKEGEELVRWLWQKEVVVIKKWIKVVGVGKRGKGIMASWNHFLVNYEYEQTSSITFHNSSHHLPHLLPLLTTGPTGS
ncbi:hypothetical protein BT69DRAFT_1295482 [Atractiella rhizophila]|nr:hypothetical protein BT69DRAFT_1295482 [Atractiella rhizophila]